eukprot:Clim_evm93s156 gene=Clim_evmTU93s156
MDLNDGLSKHESEAKSHILEVVHAHRARLEDMVTSCESLTNLQGRLTKVSQETETIRFQHNVIQYRRAMLKQKCQERERALLSKQWLPKIRPQELLKLVRHLMYTRKSVSAAKASLGCRSVVLRTLATSIRTLQDLGVNLNRINKEVLAKSQERDALSANLDRLKTEESKKLKRLAYMIDEMDEDLKLLLNEENN